VTAGNQATWSAGSAAPLLSPVDAGQALAWREGRLEYLNEPLSAVIADVNRYAKRPVTVQDASIGKIVFSGTVFTEDADVWIEALPKVFAVRLTVDRDDNLILATK
jgi:transmembrane sensor